MKIHYLMFFREKLFFPENFLHKILCKENSFFPKKKERIEGNVFNHKSYVAV